MLYDIKNIISKLNLISIFDFLDMIGVVLYKIWGSQFVGGKKDRNKCGEEIDTFVILLRLSNKTYLKKNRTSEIINWTTKLYL